MKCMFCGCEDSKVIDSRSTDDGRSIRRRRECVDCGRRFTTFETIEIVPFLVVKRDGTRQSYDRSKLKNGILRSCEKRPISMLQIDMIVDDIEKKPVQQFGCRNNVAANRRYGNGTLKGR